MNVDKRNGSESSQNEIQLIFERLFKTEMTTKRQVSLKLAPGAVVCEEKSDYVGDITIGARTVIHPKTKIIAEAGPIIIGDNNLIEEQTQIINRHPHGSDGETNPNQTVMIIGNNNVFEVGSYTEALKIGDHNVLEAKSYVGRKTILSNGCIIGSMCQVTIEEELPENTVIYGEHCERRLQQERPAPQTLQLDFLSKILPNYHHIVKTSRPKPT